MAHREPGLVGALLSTEVACGLIVDGIHVHPAVVKTASRARGSSGLTLVTDAMSAAGMAPGQYVLGDRQVIVDATSARLADGTLAGSILQMDAAVRNVMAYTGCSLADAVRMASATPARVLGISNRKGQIAPGCDADLVVLDEWLRVSLTVIGGAVAYEKR
jgi:N-acetylglucosamine-6-phosphate deacetylase